MSSLGSRGGEGSKYPALIGLRTLRVLLVLWALEPVSAAWALGNFTKHITITVGAGVVGGPLTNFPVLVDVTNADLRTTPGGSVQSVNGYDIVFRGQDTTTCGGPANCMLDHEVEPAVDAAMWWPDYERYRPA